MMEIKDIVKTYKSAERDKIFPFSEWHRKDVFEKLVKLFLIVVSYINLDRENFLEGDGLREEDALTCKINFVGKKIKIREVCVR